MTGEDGSTAEERVKRQIEAYHSAALAYAAVKLGLPEAMGSETWSAPDLARKLALSPEHLHRFMRGLVSIGICEERSEGRFALAPLGHALAPGAPSSLREKLLIVVGQYWRPWAELSHTLRTGEPAFSQVFGSPVSEWRRRHPEEGALFESYSAKEAFASADEIIPALDLSGVKTVAEIGGCGGLLAALLEAHPALNGILFDAPETVAAAEAFLCGIGVSDRVERVSGDLLTVPVKADLYLLNGVIRSFDDNGAIAILRNCRKAMPASARLAIIERLLPNTAGNDSAAIMLDLHMMTVTGGLVRDRAGIEELLTEAGFSLASTALTLSGLWIISAAPR